VEGPAPLAENDSPVWAAITTAVAEGRQAYVVASLVEDNEKIAAASAEEAFAALSNGPFRELSVGLVHGQMPRAERDQTMREFKDGDLDVLVATTVIEVGVNVPNATVMVVLDAPRFGIAQLHQIRGRVGRGSHASRCLLVGEAKSDDARTRMGALVESTDGFHLAEVDLRLRGAGALFGTRQSGQSDLRVAKLPDDLPLVQTCRAFAEDLLRSDPVLARRPVLKAEVLAALGDDAAAALTRG
jgi:ATP-dependent DNA helicase RecG